MHKINTFLRTITAILFGVLLLYSCASIGRPDGGPIDETPPVMTSSSPNINETNVTKNKISIHFDEYIRLDNASQKVVVSPPQLQQPLIKPLGKKISITLQDSLKANTTYTIDFGDAIVDNNEGNPMGDFTFTFSTGDVIDTMSVSGVVLEASNLEPVKGILVGLQDNLNDSAFTTIPFTRVASTDSRGKFTIHGVSPGKYHIFSLDDKDQNYFFSQKTEKIAFLDSIIIPSTILSIKNDTLWKDSITVDTILEKNYTKFLPDDILLRVFQESVYNQYLKKSERKSENILTLQFSEKADTLPTIKGINFDEKHLIVDTKFPCDTIINYFVKDSLVFLKDSLVMQVDYLHTDTLNQLVNKTDTILFYYKHKKTTPTKSKNTDVEEEANKPIIKELDLEIIGSVPLDVYEGIQLAFKVPLQSANTNMIQLLEQKDTIWSEIQNKENYSIAKDEDNIKIYNIFYNWNPGGSYKLKVDSAAFTDIYGRTNNLKEHEFNIKKLEDYGSVEFNITGLNNQNAFVELLNASDEAIRVEEVQNNRCGFYYLNPGKYGARLIIDSNNNGLWDTGNYENKIEPENVYYYPSIIEFKANWSTSQDWDLLSTPIPNQKPNDLKKQKPDEDKKKNRNQARTRR